MEYAKRKNVQNPRETANVASVLSFKWIFKIFRLGFKRELTLGDLYTPLNEHKAATLGKTISKLWKEQEEKCAKLNNKCKPKILLALLKMFRFELMILGFFLAFLEFSIRLAEPYALSMILAYLNIKDKISDDHKTALCWCIVLSLAVFLDCFISHTVLQALNHIGMKMRVSCNALIYRKLLRISAGDKASSGQIINLITNDTSSFDTFLFSFHYSWISVTQSLVVLYLLYQQMHHAVIGGIAVILICLPIFAIMLRWITHLTKLCMFRTDERLRLTSEIMNGIKVIKMYIWEEPFSHLEDKARKKELRAIKKQSIASGVACSLECFIPRLALFITLVTYLYMGNNLDSSKVYLVTSYYNLIRISLFGWLPYGLQFVAKVFVSARRIQNFLALPEQNSKATSLICPLNDSECIINNTAISITNYAAKWKADSDRFVLSNVNLDIHQGSLIGVIGKVGSGKSSLLHAIVDEIPIQEGKIKVNGKVSYASQEPWIFASSIRQNILFGQQMNEERYNQVIDVCQLRNDLINLPDGDQTLAGEKGVTLSGGQCARINLARAVYNDANVYLLDDPLSAVDANVAKNIFNECISKFLSEKTVILTTHQIQWLKYVDRVVILKDGAIQAQGSFQNIRNLDIDLVHMIEENEEIRKKSITGEGDMKNAVYDAINPNEQVKEQEESIILGSTKLATYVKYLSAAGSCVLVFFALLFSVFFELSCFGIDYFVASWTNAEEDRALMLNNVTLNTNGDTSIKDRTFYINIYSGLMIITVVMTFVQVWTHFAVTVRISRRLHAKMFNSIVSTSISFFQKNPLGRIMNRFSKDINVLDTLLPKTLEDVKLCLLNFISVFALVISQSIWLLIPAVLVITVTFFSRRFYIRTARCLRRLEGISRSPVIKHITATMEGLVTIRAVEAQEILLNEFNSHQDMHSSSWFLFISGSRAFGLYNEFFYFLFTSSVIFVIYIFSDKMQAAYAGLIISQCLLLTNWMSFAIRRTTDLESEITSVERIIEYTELPPEPGQALKSELTAAKNWPQKGKIEFKNVSLVYEEQKPPALKNLNFTINPEEKIGIVGRTGAGKSSIINILFRLTEFNGDIDIDGIPIKRIKLQDVRSKISIIPQQPVLFEGTLRTNLDPFEEYTDSELWQALQDVELKPLVSSDLGLDMRVMDSGTNFSVGQRQLLCLARAIIRKNKIIVLDEATANVDPQTDKLIQDTIRRKFSNATVMIVAHRLITVMDCSKILVMNDGQLVEFDHAYNLLEKKSGYFYDMVQSTGPSMSETLFNLALESYASFEERL